MFKIYKKFKITEYGLSSWLTIVDTEFYNTELFTLYDNSIREDYVDISIEEIIDLLSNNKNIKYIYYYKDWSENQKYTLEEFSSIHLKFNYAVYQALIKNKHIQIFSSEEE